MQPQTNLKQTMTTILLNALGFALCSAFCAFIIFCLFA
jgi:hypothetical protein